MSQGPSPATGVSAAEARRALVAELLQGRESALQACWAHQLWRSTRLRTAEGQALEVDFPGWLNRGPGPDFSEARLRIGGRTVVGDVEVHLRPDDWWAHGHRADPAYAKVVLHVVLEGREAQPVETGEGVRPALFLAAPVLPLNLSALLGDPEALLRRYESLPGRCGLRVATAPPEALLGVVRHAAEARARAKAERLRAPLGDADGEQLLFAQVFRYLGAPNNGEAFEALAARYPVAQLIPLLRQPYPAARAAVLSRWFGAAGLLEAPPPPGAPPALLDEFRAWQAQWRALRHEPLQPALRRAGARPWNSPERRMVGLFHHLYRTGREGWLKGWLAFLWQLDAARDLPRFAREAVTGMQRLFETPAWEPWRTLVSFHHPPLRRTAALVGKERLSVLAANALLPVFLALARRDVQPEFEKLLYRLFLILPPEGANTHTRFMLQRLAPPKALPRTLRTQQGLLQIRQDFCSAFEEGCAACGLPDLISAAGQDAAGQATARKG